MRRGETIVGDGPFTESKEWIAGLDLLEVTSLDEAIEVAAAHPMARGGALVLSPLWPLDVTSPNRESPERGRRSEPALGAVAG